MHFCVCVLGEGKKSFAVRKPEKASWASVLSTAWVLEIQVRSGLWTVTFLHPEKYFLIFDI